jgi:ABC-2 type transport system ATP-binding protein
MSSAVGPLEPVMSVDGLSVRYGDRLALDDVSFEVPRGSVFALLGRNGAGKSSLVRCALGQQKATRGGARLFGRDAWRERRRAMARVGIVPEEPDAPPDMTAAEIDRFCRPLYPTWDAASVSARLSRFGVPTDVPFGSLSKGQKGAVMLALCLAPAPELLVLDDPTLGLDAVARRALYDELIGDIADRGATVFLTSHDLGGIEALATHVAVLKGAHLAVNEELEALKARFRRIRRPRGADGWDPFVVADERVREWGTEAVVSNFTADAFERWKAQSGAADAEVVTLSLEEIFLALVGEGGGAA